MEFLNLKFKCINKYITCCFSKKHCLYIAGSDSSDLQAKEVFEQSHTGHGLCPGKVRTDLSVKPEKRTIVNSRHISLRTSLTLFEGN